LAASGAEGVKVAVKSVNVTAPATCPPPFSSVRVEVDTVAASTASENVARTVVLSATPVSPGRGATETTVGGVVSGAGSVVKDQMKSEARAFPARSCTPVRRAVYVVP
jgi:hypothetical protein